MLFANEKFLGSYTTFQSKQTIYMKERGDAFLSQYALQKHYKSNELASKKKGSPANCYTVPSGPSGRV